MLDTPGDLIPVIPSAAQIPWTRRRSQILNFLHRGPVEFTTLVYDTNVGDISPLSSYFNPQRISEKELNSKFGQYPNEGVHANVKRIGSEAVLMPRLLLYPTRLGEQNPAKSTIDQNSGNRRTLDWLLSHEGGGLQLPPVPAVLQTPEEAPPRNLEGDQANCLLGLDCINLSQQLSNYWKEPESISMSQTLPALSLDALLDGESKAGVPGSRVGIGKEGPKWDSMLFNQTTWL